MQSMFNLQTTFGLPLCVSGITHRLTFSQEMADHDLRREAMKKQRSRSREGVHANQEMGSQRNCDRVMEELRKGEVDEDLASGPHDLSYTCSACTAKAA
ncbi:uncharacterized protein LOC107420033 [Ziziphus jujuba]|uniref:Uncharacterized protein LOC107420033 n=1 Tax=Ziziphus jujuba TaxID=326968 RepID=A0A6P3ZWF8_ZIZJJ|nr:uncharacterized protein LOC107420033 [Ziziphus jujuba]